MGFGRRSFLSRTATVVGTLGAAGSAESWAREMKEQRVPAPKPYGGYERDLYHLTVEVEERFNSQFNDWPEMPSTPRSTWRYGEPEKIEPEWDAYDEAYERAFERCRQLTCIYHNMGVVAPVCSAVVADAMGYLEQDEAKPVLIVAAPVDFSDVRKMTDRPGVDLVYDEGPIRARIFTVPVVSSTKIDRGNILVAGIRKDGDLRMTHLQITR